jgi:ubiquinone biosynthesis protein
MDMIFRDQFYHADTHPGNLLIQSDGSLGVIDCGMVSRIDSQSNKLFEEVIIGVAQKDAEHIKNTILEMCTLPEGVNNDLITYQIEGFIEQFLDLPLNEFDVSASIKEITSIIEEHHIIIPPNVSTLFKTITMLEGSSRLLNPNFNIAILFKKYHFKILKRRLAPKSILKKLAQNIHQWELVADLLPIVLNKLLKKAGADNFEVNLKHKNLENSVNRIVMALIASAFFLGSSLLWAFKVPPVFYDYSVFGVLGIAISSYIAIKLIRGIKKNE